MTDDLRKNAIEVWANAYAPYSNFQVGAALRGVSGRIYVGCNVENVAYPEGTCAEAGAIAAMVATGETEFVEAYVISGNPLPVTPCGGCRQKMAEFGKADAMVTSCGIDSHPPARNWSGLRRRWRMGVSVTPRLVRLQWGCVRSG